MLIYILFHIETGTLKMYGSLTFVKETEIYWAGYLKSVNFENSFRCLLRNHMSRDT